MIFLLQGIEGVEPGINRIELLRTEVYPLSATAYLVGYILELDVSAVYALSQFARRGIYALDGM